MRIAMIGQKRTGSREGGVEVVVTELATRMVALGHEVICYDRSGTDINGNIVPSKPYEFEGVHVIPVGTIDVKGFSALSSAYIATRVAIKDSPDVIHYHAEGPCNALPLARKAGIRTVATIHGLDWRRAKWNGIAAQVIKHGEKAAVKASDEIIVLSAAIQNYFMDKYKRSTTYIPNGIEIKQACPADAINTKWGLHHNSYILFLARIVPEKRVDLLLDAFRQVRTNKKLVIAGAASDTSDYMETIRVLAAKDPRVIMTGFVEGKELSELYSNAFCYVLPSDLEGMPMSLLEAMSYGCCCITSDIAECKDVLGTSGYSFSAGNASELAYCLSERLETPDQSKLMGEKARLHVEHFYNWDSVIQETLNLYSESAQ